LAHILTVARKFTELQLWYSTQMQIPWLRWSEKLSFGFTVLAIFQQPEVQFLGHNCRHKSLGEHLDHKIYDNFGIQHIAQKCKETWIKKIKTSSSSD